MQQVIDLITVWYAMHYYNATLQSTTQYALLWCRLCSWCTVMVQC